MSEEEIIKYVEETLNYDEDKKHNRLIEALLDLYNKEKEKNRILQEELNNKIKALDIAMSNPDYICKDKLKEIMYPTPTNPIPLEV